MNVPDRLDLQEVRARADQDDDTGYRGSYFGAYSLAVWFKRLLLLGVVLALGYYAYGAFARLRDDVSAASVGARMSKALGRPVRVASSGFRFTPAPRLVLRGVDIGGDYQLSEVSVYFDWRSALDALRGGTWRWGEAAVASLKLDGAQGLALLQSLETVGSAIPATISTLRFESIEFVEVPLLPRRYRLVTKRGADGRFGAVSLSEIGTDGHMRLTLSSKVDSDRGPTVDFQLQAANWILPVGPAARWGEVVASGRARPDLVEAEFSLGGAFGAVQGAVLAARDVEWAITGTVRAPNLDLEAVLQHLSGRAAEHTAVVPAAVPLQGTAVLDTLVAGRGETLAQAIDDAVAVGSLQVRWAALNGVNLGFAAARGGIPGGAGGGFTRFSELAARVRLSRSGLSVTEIQGRAGAMSTRGEIRVAADLGLSGNLRVDLGVRRVQAPIHLKVRGTALQPQFGR